MHEKGQKGEQNFDVISSPEKRLCFLVTLANKPCMDGGEREKNKYLSPSGGKRQSRSTNQLTGHRRANTETGQPARQQPANEAERAKGELAAAPAAL